MIKSKWSLRVAGGNVAKLVIPPDDPDGMRIAIEKVHTETGYDIQLNQPHLKVMSNHSYRIQFRARADNPRKILLGFAQAHVPWTGLGLYREISLTPEWQSFQEEFTATAEDDNARIHFDVGGSDISVELSGVVLLGLLDGQPIKPVNHSLGSGKAQWHKELWEDLPECRQHLAMVRESVARQDTEQAPAPGEVRFGALRRVTPISREFGYDRGFPVDRYYIHKFLGRYAGDIRGRVLDIGDNSYTLQFGGERVTASDILHVDEGNPQATIVADLTHADHIPTGLFDCIIFTQTLQFIYDVRAAIATLYRILKPGGVLLATFPGISQWGRGEWSNDWYWSFTVCSAQQLFSEVFPISGVEVEAYGNVLSATSFLYGLAAEELHREELDYNDPDYQVLITARAVKANPSAALHLKSRSDHQALIMMYHRVIDVRPDPWELCVTPKHFAEHLEVLRADFHPIRLTELPGALDKGEIPDRSVVVTFDDGYADNLYEVKPLLERYKIPATVFITSGCIGRDQEFWWDELERLLFHPGTLPETLDLKINGKTRRWELDESVHWSADDILRHRGWKFSAPSLSRRHELFREIYELLQPLPANEQWKALEAIRVWANIRLQARTTHRALSLPEAVELAKGELVEIGAHTATHPVLSALTIPAQQDELERSKSDLEKLLNRPVSSFTYPYGGSEVFTADTVRAVRKAGFHCACTTAEGIVHKGSDQFHLPRVMVCDWDGETFAKRMATWFDGDRAYG